MKEKVKIKYKKEIANIPPQLVLERHSHMERVEHKLLATKKKKINTKKRGKKGLTIAPEAGALQSHGGLGEPENRTRSTQKKQKKKE